jgi:sulfite oxidase
MRVPIEAERRLVSEQKLQLRLLDDEALNAEPNPAQLDESITSVEFFFIRNNGRLPTVSAAAADNWKLVIDGAVERPQEWTLRGIQNTFESVTFAAVLECAGNGRSGYSPRTEGLQWGHGAVACARWTGVRLRDLLMAAGLKETAVYTGHISPDTSVEHPSKPALSRGLPIAKALAPETLVAFGMNGKPLPLLHGGPVRIVAPGFPGSAWQKWLTRIWVRDREHDGEKMTGTNYRLPTTPITPGEAHEAVSFAVIEDMPIKSLITYPAEGFTARTGTAIEVRGFAWSGHTPVSFVDVCTSSEPWIRAQLEPQPQRFAWRRFRAIIPCAETGLLTLVARATDEAGRSQPLTGAPWNPRGYCNNTVHRVSGSIHHES